MPPMKPGPPSMDRVWPLTQLLIGLTRNKIPLAMSSGWPTRRSGTWAPIVSGVSPKRAQERTAPSEATPPTAMRALSRRNDDIAVEYASLLRRTRERLAGMLAAAQEEGVLRLHAKPDAVADILFSLGDGFALRMISEPDRDFSASIQAGIECARSLVAD